MPVRARARVCVEPVCVAMTANVCGRVWCGTPHAPVASAHTHVPARIPSDICFARVVEGMFAQLDYERPYVATPPAMYHAQQAIV